MAFPASRTPNSWQALREALKIRERALVQPWAEGVQLSVPVIGTGWNAFALPRWRSWRRGWYDAAARQASDAVELHVPCATRRCPRARPMPGAIRAEDRARGAGNYRALGMRDCGCIDLIWDGAQAPSSPEAVAGPCFSR